MIAIEINVNLRDDLKILLLDSMTGNLYTLKGNK